MARGALTRRIEKLLLRLLFWAFQLTEDPRAKTECECPHCTRHRWSTNGREEWLPLTGEEKQQAPPF